jgi:3-dehydroquinate dehydratase / shikimate dehydrogenase
VGEGSSRRRLHARPEDVICYTGLERTAEELAQRLEAPGDGILHELRLDALALPEAALPLVVAHRDRVVVCCRSKRQGGGFDGDEGTRLSLLGHAARAGARFVDVEADVEDAAVTRIADPAHVVLSWHDFDGVPADLEARAAAMSARGAAVVKIAVTVADAGELDALLAVRPGIGQDAVLVGMGAAGLVSRVRYRSFGSAWTYVGAAGTTAPGQLDAQQAALVGLPASGAAPFLALVGGAQIAHSPGMHVYNRWLRAHGRDECYLGVVTRSLARTLPLLERVGARGLSVTMPLKEEALRLARADALATRVGAANSLRRGADGWEATNTDVEGVRAPLDMVLPRDATHALVLGAGGAARAAVAALGLIGLEVAVAARSAERAAALGSSVVPWEARAEDDVDVLVNATPIGGDESPWPEGAELPAVVFDLALGPTSRLLDEARRQGRVPLDARQMWVHQGAAQMRWMLGADVGANELSGLMP